MRIVGRVERRLYAKGSKSERQAIILVTDDGEYLLRREGGNPFHDEALSSLVNHRIQLEGKKTDVSIIMTKWKVLD